MLLSLSNLKRRALYLETIIEEKEQILENEPKGILRISNGRGNTQFYSKASSKDKKWTFLRKKDRKLASALAQRDYDQRVLNLAMKELSTLNKLIGRYELGTVEDIYGKLQPARRALVTPILLPDEEFAKNRLAQSYEGLGFEEGAPEYYAESGLRVRSKSEIGIANKYDEFEIPMLFERPIKLKGWKTVYPDFTLLNVRLRKEFIHEHLGKMDDQEYLMENIAKINAYMKNGYFPGKNLILTFETKSQPFDLRIMDLIINQYLL